MLIGILGDAAAKHARHLRLGSDWRSNLKKLMRWKLVADDRRHFSFSYGQDLCNENQRLIYMKFIADSAEYAFYAFFGLVCLLLLHTVSIVLKLIGIALKKKPQPFSAIKYEPRPIADE